MRLFHIEPSAFQATEHRLNRPTLVIVFDDRIGLLSCDYDLKASGRPSRGYIQRNVRDFSFAVPGLRLVQLEVTKKLGCLDGLATACQNLRVTLDAQSATNTLLIQPPELFLAHKFTVGQQHIDLGGWNQNENFFQHGDVFIRVGVASLLIQTVPGDRNRIPLPGNRDHQIVDVLAPKFPVSSVHTERVAGEKAFYTTVTGFILCSTLEVFSNAIEIA